MNLNQNHIEIKIIDFEKGHQEITDLLGLNPTKKWLMGEEYLVGPTSKQTKIYLSIAIKNLYANITNPKAFS